MASITLDNAAQLYGTLHHFFEVAVHTVLYYRRLYPERAFATATAFDVPVHQSRHPAVCAWIRAAVEQVMAQIAGDSINTADPGTADKQPADRVNAVAVVVHAPYTTSMDDDDDNNLPAGAVLERWVFDVRHLPRCWPGGIEALRRTQADRSRRGREDRGNEGDPERREARRARRRSPDKAAAGGDGDSDEARYNYYDEEEELANAESEAELDADSEGEGDSEREVDEAPGDGSVNRADLNDQLRGVLQRLAQAGQQVAALPAGCTFTVAIELGDDAGDTPGDRRSMDTNWVPDTGFPKQRPFGAATGAPGATTTSIRSVDSAPLYLECWVEESALKQAAATGATRAQMAAAVAASGAGDVLPPPHDDAPLTATTASHKGKNVSFS